MNIVLQPSKNAMVPFVSVANMVRLINAVGIDTIMKELIAAIELDFRRWPQFDKIARVASHSKEGVIELMPTSDGELYAFKYVNGHPSNSVRGFQTVTAFGLLADVNTGYPILITEMTLLTALRTAATSAVAAKYLAPEQSHTMAVIGNGAQAEFQILALKSVRDLRCVRLYDIDPSATKKTIANLRGQGIETMACASAEEAVEGAQIVTTCTADKQLATVLTDNMVGPGIHINAIGGDCPGKTELHRDILLRSDTFVEFTPQTRIEGEIQQMSSDYQVVELWEVIAGRQHGRSNKRQITLFDSVGFAIEDFSALKYVHGRVMGTDFVDQLDMIADPDSTIDLFGMVLRARGGSSGEA